MKTMVGGILGLLAGMVFMSNAWAYSTLAECDTPEKGGICQRELIGLEPGAHNYVTVIVPAACFPQVVNMRVSKGTVADSSAPFGTWIAQSGTSYDGVEGRLSFYIQNSSSYPAMPLWLRFVWECERRRR